MYRQDSHIRQFFTTDIATAALFTFFRSGVIDQDLPHCLGRQMQEMPAVLADPRSPELKESFMNQRRGLQSMPRRLAMNMRLGNAAKFFVNLGKGTINPLWVRTCVTAAIF
jgi:hypothetical protein